MSAASYELKIEQGVSFDKTFTVKNSDGTFKDLTAYTARMMLREDYSSAAPLVSLVSPSSGGSGLDLDAFGGIRVQMTAAATALFSFYRVFWDIELVDGAGKVTRVLNGEAVLSREVTK